MVETSVALGRRSGPARLRYASVERRADAATSKMEKAPSHRDTFAFVLLLTPFVVLFCKIAGARRRRAAMEGQLLDRLDQMDQQLMDTVQRRNTLA